MKRIPLETWGKARNDYLHRIIPTMPALAAKYGLRKKTIEKRAGREQWTTLRRLLTGEQFPTPSTSAEKSALSKSTALTPPAKFIVVDQLRQEIQPVVEDLLAAAERQQHRILSRLKSPAIPAVERQQCADDYLALARDWLALSATAAKWGVFPESKSTGRLQH